MSRKLCAAVVLLLLGRPCWAECDMTFSDTNTVSYYRDSDKHISYNFNRLRSDIDLKDSSGQVSLKAVGDVETYFGDSFTDTAACRLIENADPDLPFNPYFNVLEEDMLFARLYLYRLYAEFKGGRNDLSLGLQRIPFGAGRLWNPTDTFNPVDALSIEPDERRGAFAVNFIRNLTDFSYLQLISNFGGKMEMDKYGLRYKGRHLGMDVGASFIQNASFYMIGGELESNLFDTGIEVRAEAGFFDNDDLGKQYFGAVAGAEYGFSNNVTLLAEYFYNGLGADDEDDYNPAILINGNWNYARHYFGLKASYEMSPLTTVSLTSIINPPDGSCYAGPSLRRSINDETTLTIGAGLYCGSDTSEFGGYYDNHFYMKLESYF